MSGQLRRNDLPGQNTPPECSFQCASLGLFNAKCVAVYLLDGLLPLASTAP